MAKKKMKFRKVVKYKSYFECWREMFGPSDIDMLSIPLLNLVGSCIICIFSLFFPIIYLFIRKKEVYYEEV